MTLKDSLELRHNKYVVYLQIWSAFCLSIFASQAFNLLKIETNFFQTFIINNYVLGTSAVVAGLLFFRRNLAAIESRAEKLRAEPMVLAFPKTRLQKL